MPVDIPQDIIELIVSRIPLDFPSTEAQCALLACTAVSNSFRYSARRALFSTVTLEAHPLKSATATSSQTEHLVSLHDLFFQNSELKRLVRHLQIHVDDRRILLQDDENLSAIINLLMDVPMLGTFWITGCRRRPFEWENIGPLTRTSIVRLLDRNNLQNIRLSNILGVPPSLIQQTGSLRNVEFIHATFDPAVALPTLSDDIHNPTRETAPTGLRSLTVHGYIFHFDATFLNSSSPTTSWPAFSTLCNFKGLIRDRMGVNALSHILQTASASLSHLTLMIRVDAALMGLSSINLAQLPLLESLTLCIQTGNIRPIPRLHHVFVLLFPQGDPNATPHPLTTTLKELSITVNAVAPHRAPQSITRAHSAATYAPALRSSFSLDPSHVDSSSPTWTIFNPDQPLPQSRVGQSGEHSSTKSHWTLVKPSTLKKVHPALRSVEVVHDFKLPSVEAKDSAQMKLAKRVLELELAGVFDGFEADAVRVGVEWRCVGLVS